jgi:hypothetical protein
VLAPIFLVAQILESLMVAQFTRWFAAARLAARLRRNGWYARVKHVGFEQYKVFAAPPHYLVGGEL